MTDVDDEILGVSPTKAGRLLGIGRTRVYELLNAQKLEAKKSNTRTLITKRSIEKYFESLPPYKGKS